MSALPPSSSNEQVAQRFSSDYQLLKTFDETFATTELTEYDADTGIYQPKAPDT